MYLGSILTLPARLCDSWSHSRKQCISCKFLFKIRLGGHFSCLYLPLCHVQVHAEEAPGDILVFMTGQDEIEALERLLQAHVASQLTLPGATNSEQQLQLMIVSIFSAMPPEQQLKVLLVHLNSCTEVANISNTNS